MLNERRLRDAGDAHSFSRKPGADRKDTLSSYPQGDQQSSRQELVLTRMSLKYRV